MILHRHNYEMTFPSEGLEWVFVCRCGDTCRDIRQAYMRTLISMTLDVLVTLLLLIVFVGGIAIALIDYGGH